MSSEIRRMLSGRGFLAAVLLGCLGIAMGAVYPELKGLQEDLLESGSFLTMEAGALSSQTVGFLLPVAAVLPWSDSFLEEWKGGFLKASLPRLGRRLYVESKVFTVAFGGFLAWLASGALVLFGYFLIFFPLEKKGAFPAQKIVELLFPLLRGSLLAAGLASFGGICGTATGSVYMAYGLPFVGYYFCMILHERYFEEALWLYPREWLAGSGDWGAHGQGLWLFLLLFLGMAMAVHGGVLHGRLEEI